MKKVLARYVCDSNYEEAAPLKVKKNKSVFLVALN